MNRTVLPVLWTLLFLLCLYIQPTDAVAPVVVNPAAPTVTYNLEENDSTATNIFAPVTFVVTDADGDLTSPPTVTVASTPAATNAFVWLTTSNDGATLTGELRAAAGFLFDHDDPAASPTTFTITVTFNDAATSSVSTDIVVNVQDINDNPPAVLSTCPSGGEVASLSATVAEDLAVGSAITFTPAVYVGCDPDDVDQNLLTFTLIGDGDQFFVDSRTGDVFLSSALDYDTGDTGYSFILRVTDTAGHFDVVPVTVTVTDVNDEPPACSSDVYVYSAGEGAGSLGTQWSLSCVDPEGDVLTANIAGAPTPFSVTGGDELRVATALDYETDTSHELRIEIQDATATVLTTTVTVLIQVIPVNEDTPVWTPGSSPVGATWTLVEGTAAGTVIDTVEATDGDDASTEDGVVEYSITSVVTDSGSNAMDRFDINSATGELRTRAVLDREGVLGSASYSITIRASDGGGLFADGVATVNVEDVNEHGPEFVVENYQIYVAEDETGLPLDLLTLSALRDADDTTAAIASYGITSGNTGSIFDINTTPDPPVLRLTTTINPDNPDNHAVIYNLEVTVTDVDGLTGVCYVQVEVTLTNDHTPVWTTAPATVFNMVETDAAGSVIGHPAATDADIGDDGVIDYYIQSGSDTYDFFAVNPSTGELTLRTQIDYDALVSLGIPTTLPLTIEARDRGTPALVDTIDISVAVADVDTTPPVCVPASGTATVVENSLAGTMILDITCSDTDTAALTFTVSAGNTGGAFTSVDTALATQIQIGTAAAVDYETQTSFSLEVTVSDGTAANDIIIPVEVTLLPVNDNVPVFTGAPYTATTAEDLAVGSTLPVTIAATDADLGPHGITNLEFKGGTYIQDHFQLDPATGGISLIEALDFETATTHVLTVVARDPDNIVETTVTVTVTDVADDIIQCTLSSTTVLMYDDVIPAQLLTVACTGTLAAPVYTMSVNPAQAAFTLDAATGIVTTTALDIDLAAVPRSYELTLSTTAAGSPSLAATVTVLPLNDVAPVFAMDPLTAPTAWPEDSTPGAHSVTMAATDGDLDALHNTITYSLTGADQDIFVIDPSTGEITVSGGLDFEQAQTHNLLVVASDGVHQTTGEVIINVGDVNDSPISCTSTTSHVIVNEEFTDLTFVLASVACVDLDADATNTYNFRHEGDTGSDFTFTQVGTSAHGELKLANASPDYDNPAETRSWQLTVYVSDGVVEDGVPITVTLNPINEPPTFLAAVLPAAVTVAEDTAVGAFTRDCSAQDPDQPPHHIVRYHLTGDEGTQHFSLDPTTGELSLSKALDFEHREQYVLTIQAVDGGGLSVKEDLTINVGNVNDVIPVCTLSTYSAKLPESAPINQQVAHISCIDPDTDVAGDLQLTFTFASGNDDAVFRINPAAAPDVQQADVIVADTNNLDWDVGTQSYTLVVRVSDGSNTVDVTLPVTVEPVNEATPVFAANPFDAGGGSSVDEDLAEGSVVTTYQATDTDAAPHDVVLYEIIGTAGSNHFVIDETTGEVILVKRLDAETRTQHHLTIRATDGGGLSTVTDAIVQVNDINDNAPTCLESGVSKTILEDEPNNHQVASVSCSDPDGDALTYALLDDTNNVFAIDNTGAVTVANTAIMDYDSPTKSYSLRIRVTDALAVHTVDLPLEIILDPVNEHTPTFPAPTLLVPKLEDTAVGDIINPAYRAQDDDHAPHNVVRYAFDGTSIGHENFDLDPVTGEVTLGIALDRETRATHTLVLVAEDGGGLRGVGTITVQVEDVNDNSPICNPSSWQISYPENTPDPFPAAENLIDTLNCYDIDPDFGTLTYIITDAAPGAPGDGIFAVDPNNPANDGRLLLETPLDFDGGIDRYRLNVQIQDNGLPPNTLHLPVYIAITPVNEGHVVFAPAGPYTVNIVEDSLINTLVFDVDTTDTDRPAHPHGDHRYTIMSGDPAGQFAIESTTGAIRLSSPLDYETDSVYELIILAREVCLDHSATTTLTVSVVDVNDNEPVCDTRVFSVEVAEDVAVPAQINAVNFGCVDADEDGLQVVSYTHNGDAARFTAQTNGFLSINQPLDYDAGPRRYDFVITANDPAPIDHAVAIQSTVIVLPVNEHSPVITSANPAAVSVNEDESPGFHLYTMTAVDADSALTPHGQILYVVDTVVPVQGEGHFVVDPISGQVLLAASVDYEDGINSYTLTLSAWDNLAQNPDAMQATMSLTVDIVDINDNAPQFTATVYNVDVLEATADDVVVTTIVAATDQDSPNNNNNVIQYTLAGGDGNADFTVDLATGVIRTTVGSTINREVKDFYTLILEASDLGTPSLTSSAIVQITVLDINDHDPVFSPDDFHVSIFEEQPVDLYVTSLFATDADIDLNALLTFTISPTSDIRGHFYVLQTDPNTADLYTRSILDREDTGFERYNLEIEAYDAGTPSRTGTATVAVHILDINDNTPVFTNTPYDVTIPEDTFLRTEALQVTTQDLDEGENARVTYNIIDFVEGRDGDFDINEDTGRLRVASNLNRERDPVYRIRIRARDHGTPVLSATYTATVTVSDVNDHTPQFLQTAYTFSLSEDLPVGSSIGRVTATDDDTGANAAVQYSIRRYTQGIESHFTIDPDTGDMTVLSSNLDREADPVYGMIVRATDEGDPARSSEVPVTIRLTDANDVIPLFSQTQYTTTIPENTPASTTLLSVSASDLDLNDNQQLSYTLDGASDVLEYFTIEQLDNSNALLVLLKAPDYEMHRQFDFYVRATDTGDSPLYGRARVLINIEDLNDNAPTFSQSFYSAEMSYKESSDVVVVSVAATDPDSGLNSRVAYSFKENYDVFQLDSETGDISKDVDHNLDRFTRYSLSIVATDGGSSARGTEVEVRVDTFDPDENIVMINMTVPIDDLLLALNDFLTSLTQICSIKYQDCVVKLWRAHALDGSASVTGLGRSLLQTDESARTSAWIYAFSNNEADTGDFATQQKEFISSEDLLDLYQDDEETKSPSSFLEGPKFASYDVTSVEAYSTDDTPWIETVEGYSVVISLLLLLLLGCVAMGGVIYYLANKNKKKKKEDSSLPLPPLPTPSQPVKRHNELYYNEDIHDKKTVENIGLYDTNAMPLSTPSRPPTDTRLTPEIAAGGAAASRKTTSRVSVTHQ